MKRSAPLKRKTPKLPACTCDLPEVGQFDHGPFCPRNHNRMAEAWSRKMHAAIACDSKPRKPLPPRSKKLAAKIPEYEAAKRTWRKGHDGRCEMRFHLLTMDKKQPRAPFGFADGFQCMSNADKNPHHMAGRGPNLSRIETFLGVCRQCHDWIHANAREARRLGYLK